MRHFRNSSRGRRAGSRSGENNSISPIPHSVSALIITSTASEAPGVRGNWRKLYVMVPKRTPLTTESIFAANAAYKGRPAKAVLTKSRREMDGITRSPLWCGSYVNDFNPHVKLHRML